MNRTLTAIALATLAAAQMTAQPSPRTSEIVRVEHQRADTIFKLIGPMLTSSTNAAFDNDLKTITLSGPSDVVEMLVKNIARLDTAPSGKSIELTVYLLTGSDTEGKLPDDISGVVKQLHGVFPHKGYLLLDTTVLRSLDGKGASTSGQISNSGTPGMPATTYDISTNNAHIEGNAPARTISLTLFRFAARFPFPVGPAVTLPNTQVPQQFQFGSAVLNTDVSLKEGQKIVIGKSSLGPGRESLFVVLSTKIIE